SAIRYAGLEAQLISNGHNVTDLGNVTVPIAESLARSDIRLKYLEPILGMAEELCKRVGEMVHRGLFPLVLGGDHSISLGSVAGISQNRRIGVLWLDAHGDFNVANTSPSGNIHGMVLS